jgi:hypothetical protein
MMDSKEDGSNQGAFKIPRELGTPPTRLILQISAVATVALVVIIAVWVSVIIKWKYNDYLSQPESVEPFRPAISQMREPMPFTQHVRDSQSCSDNDLVCMQVATLQPSEVFKGVNGLIPTDTTKHYLVKISVSPIEDIER